MDPNEGNIPEKEAQDSQSEEQAPASQERRSFLGTVGALGLGAIFSDKALGSISEEHGNPKQAPVLQGMKDLRVIKQEEFAIPGGTEQNYEWEIVGTNKVTSRFRVYSLRIDHGSAHYTTVTDTTIQTYAAGEPPAGKTEWVRRQRVVVNGTKGQATKDSRTDHVTFTTIYEDGRSYRMSRSVTVKLGLNKFNGASSFEEMLKTMAKKNTKGPGKAQDDLS